jgi:anthranilate synthase component 1
MRPSLHDVLLHRGGETHIAVCAELSIDTETPLSLFQYLSAQSTNAFLFDSALGSDGKNRYSFFGYDIKKTLTIRDGHIVMRDGDRETEINIADPLAAIREMSRAYSVVRLDDDAPFQGGVIGYLGFNCVAAMERVPLAQPGGIDVPDAMMFLVTDLCVYDHLTHRLMLITHIPLEEDRTAAYQRARQRIHDTIAQLTTPRQNSAAPMHAHYGYPSLEEAVAELDVQCSRTRHDMEASITIAKELIAQGEVFQVVISQRVMADCNVPPIEVYRALCEVSPAPYMFFLQFDGITVLGASPEMLVRMQADKLSLCPIAGTRPRGTTAADDAALQRELISDQKELAEHHMLVDLGRNDLGRVAQSSSVRVEQLARVVQYSHVMHLVSDVHAQLSPRHDAYDVLRACFPAGTVSGAPKVRACELIAQLEPDRRGVYAGMIGYVDFGGNMDTCIAIRTIVIVNGQASLQTGAGIVHDSIPSNEVSECWNKACAGLVALALAQRRHDAKIRPMPGAPTESISGCAT